METASVIRRFHRALRPPAGRKGSTGKSLKGRTAGTNRNGFLNHGFEPFWGVAFCNWKAAERQFFISADNLCDLYGWTKPEVSGLSFPENIRQAYACIIAQQPGDFGLQIKICQDKRHSCSLVTAKAFDTAYSLYYIPVRPLWKIREVKTERPRYEMLMTLFAYLYQVAGVPFFNEPGTVDGNYETIRNWLDEVEEDGEGYFRQAQKKELKELENAGGILYSEIQQRFTLKRLERQLAEYQKTADADSCLTEVITEFVKLIRDYPKRKLRESMYYEDEQGDNNTIYWEQYISFYWSGRDSLAETFFQMVNDEFQEMGYQEEPLSMQWFDKPQEKPFHEFDFEAKFFSLIEILADLLNNNDDEEFNQQFL